MKHSQLYMKWFSRSLLFILLLIMTYVATKPVYNLAHWIPHGLFKQLGLSYENILWAEQNLDKAMHFFGALVLTSLLIKADLLFIKKQHAFVLIALTCLCAEFVQLLIGRSFNSIDLLLGILGSFMAYLGITENRRKPA